MNRRILVNLCFFAGVGLVLAYWAIGSVLQIDLRNPPYTVTADFTDSPGLQSGFDVGYLGTPIGRIDGVHLAEGHVEVELAIEPDHRIPEGSQLAVRRKSAVGEPYVDVIPPEGSGTDGPFLEDGAHIPVTDTITPLSYSELFDALDEVVGTIPEDDFGTLLRELADAIDGRAGSIRDVITGGDDALATFADNSELFRRATGSLARLTRVFADHADSLGQGIENSRVLTGALGDARRDLDRLLRDGRSLADRTADLLAGSQEDVTCTLGGLAALAAGIDRPEVLAAIEELLLTAGDGDAVFDSVIAWEGDGPYVRGIPPLNIGGEDPVPVYPEPRPLPDIADPVGCPAMTPNPAPGGAAAAGPGGQGSAGSGPSAAADPGPAPQPNEEQASSDERIGDRGFDPLLALLALLAVAAAAALRPWRFLRRG